MDLLGCALSPSKPREKLVAGMRCPLESKVAETPIAFIGICKLNMTIIKMSFYKQTEK